MGLLDELMGGGQAQGVFKDFVDRYDQGAPHEGIDEQETAQRYGQVAGQVDPSTYQQSAQDSLANMDPQQRAEYGQQLSAAADQQGVTHGWDGATDPQALAQMTTNVHQQAPDLLGGLLGEGGGGAGGLLGGLIGGAGGGGGGNPVMKAALGGIAAMAAKKMMGGTASGSGLAGLS